MSPGKMDRCVYGMKGLRIRNDTVSHRADFWPRRAGFDRARHFLIKHGWDGGGVGSAWDRAHLLVGPGTLSDVLVLLGEDLVDLLHRRCLLLLGLVCQADVAQTPRVLLVLLELLLDPFDVLQPQLGRDDLHVSQRVDIALDVDDLGVVECPDTLEDTVDGPDVRQEGVTKTGTGRGASCQTGNVDAGEECRHLGGRLVDLAQPVESRVRYRDTSLLGVTRTKHEHGNAMPRLDLDAHSHGRIWEVGRLAQVGLRKGVEKTRLADVWQSDDTDLSRP
jgi:hypothetical protein